MPDSLPKSIDQTRELHADSSQEEELAGHLLVPGRIAAKRTSLSPQEALELADRARRFIRERGRPPSVTSADAWEKRMAEGAAAFMRFRKEGRYD